MILEDNSEVMGHCFDHGLDVNLQFDLFADPQKQGFYPLHFCA